MKHYLFDTYVSFGFVVWTLIGVRSKNWWIAGVTAILWPVVLVGSIVGTIAGLIRGRRK